MLSALRKSAVAATDNGLLAPKLAAGIAHVKSAKSIGAKHGKWPTLRQVRALLNAPDNNDDPGSPRPRHHHRGAARLCPPPCQMAALTDMRSSGAFTSEATVAARRMRRNCRHGACDAIRTSAMRTLAVAATDNGILAPERAASRRGQRRSAT